ncbi:hypothetical protein [Gordonia westfalica]|uniref:hypothetical protein n=1 Tax=Gordonia westfalica TaxID=158898 RepID=UPI00135647FE|nr:hypothetical protein [Gordonia westfalica]
MSHATSIWVRQALDVPIAAAAEKAMELEPDYTLKAYPVALQGIYGEQRQNIDADTPARPGPDAGIRHRPSCQHHRFSARRRRRRETQSRTLRREHRRRRPQRSPPSVCSDVS